MINTGTLESLTSISSVGLTRILADSGYAGSTFESARFEGIVKSGAFCYSVSFYDNDANELETGSVFVYYDHNTKKLTADF